MWALAVHAASVAHKLTDVRHFVSTLIETQSANPEASRSNGQQACLPLTCYAWLARSCLKYDVQQPDMCETSASCPSTHLRHSLVSVNCAYEHAGILIRSIEPDAALLRRTMEHVRSACGEDLKQLSIQPSYDCVGKLVVLVVRPCEDSNAP